MSGKIKIEGKNLVFEINGIDIILAIKKIISIPLDHVVSVSDEKVPWAVLQHLRLGGTSVPGIVKDGRYLTREGLMFFEMHHPDKCITVTLNHELYKKIIFEVDDKETAIRLINDAIGKDRSEK